MNGHTVESDVPSDAKFTDTVYDDTAIRELINSKIDESALVDYAKKTDLKTKLSEFENDAAFVTNTVDNLTNYYLKTETYTRDEVNNLISNINKITVEVVTKLPTEAISTSTIYLILIDAEKNVYSQNMYINGKWAILGSTSVDLTGYVKSDELTTKLEAYATNESVETHTSNNDIHVTTDEKTSWNNAATASHSHENKTILDGITEEKITAYNKAVTDDHTHSNKDVIDTITQENIDKWNSGGASYIPGQGISISDDNVISTDFTILSNEISVATTTKLVSSESKVASLSMIGSLIKEDQSLVTKDELDSKVPKVNIDFSSETSIDVNQTTEVKTGSYKVTSDCFAGCYITETSESITANAYATISVDGKPVCSVVNDGTIAAGIGNVIRVPKGTTINYTLKSNGIQTASISVFNCI